jgi:hypothetical protein
VNVTQPAMMTICPVKSCERDPQGGPWRLGFFGCLLQ